jgi:hypothetical protein
LFDVDWPSPFDKSLNPNPLLLSMDGVDDTATPVVCRRRVQKSLGLSGMLLGNFDWGGLFS